MPRHHLHLFFVLVTLNAAALITGCQNDTNEDDMMPLSASKEGLLALELTFPSQKEYTLSVTRN